MPVSFGIFFSLTTLFVLAGAHAAAAESASYAAPVAAGTLEAPPGKETSGLAASRRAPDLLWLLEDSGPPRLYGVSPTGTLRGTLRILGVENTDWEDLASFELDGKSWLLIADTGDNDARRAYVWLHCVEEPDPAHLDTRGDLSVRPAWSLKLRYEDGPRDCESVAVDVEARRIYLLTKRETPARLYSVPLAASTDRIAIAKFAGPVPHAAIRIMPEVPLMRLFGQMRGLVTGMDFAPDGSAAVVLTYADTLLYPRAAGETWATALAREPLRLAPHNLPQAEAVGFTHDGRSIFVASELNQTLLRYEREN
jgi:hypothetical protein